MKEVERTIDDLCKLIQKKTENCKESYEVNELTELTKALAELISCMNSATFLPFDSFVGVDVLDNLATVISTVFSIK